jgi:5-methylcytosine-specific restriction enzyme A
MSLKDDLHEDMIALHTRSGEELGYWPSYYLRAVRRHGGLAKAKEMLQPRTAAQRAGLDRLLEEGRPDLSLEHLVLTDKYRPLFTDEELAEAKTRLEEMYRELKENPRHRLYPDELDPDGTYSEGARKQVLVNAYERDSRARKACLKHHGFRCAVCDLSFGERYGPLGERFIHVHHLRALASLGKSYRVDPKCDLLPVCPNCHAMLHRKDPPLTVEELREALRQAGNGK